MIPSHITVDLKPLRKNSRQSHFATIELNKDGVVNKTTYYSTMREAVYHAISIENGDVIQRGFGKRSLKAFWCKWDNCMKFGFGADEYERKSINNDLYWAKFKTI